MVERLAGHKYYCFLDGYSGYNQVQNNHVEPFVLILMIFGAKRWKGWSFCSKNESNLVKMTEISKTKMNIFEKEQLHHSAKNWII
jgi:hypothetical protein